mgnify:CR=1 FL=1
MNGIAVLAGEIIDIVGSSFKGRDGDVKKLQVLIKASPESKPVECVAFGKVAERFEEEGLKYSTVMITCNVVGKEYTNESGRTFRNADLYVRDWNVMNGTNNTGASAPQQAGAVPF